MYISDGQNIRVVSPEGQIETLIGTMKRPTGPPRPFPCQEILKVDQDFQLQWPTKMALNPVDGSLYIVDDTMILKLTSDLRLLVIAGTSPICSGDYNITKRETLGPIVDLDFDYDGSLYFIDKRPPKKNTILHLFKEGQPGQIINQTLGAITAFSIGPDGKLYLGDNEALKIRQMETLLPGKNADSGDVQVPDSISGLLYTFNRFSQHVATHNLGTGELIYRFVYTKNTALGKLSDVTDTVGNSISFQRDYAGRLKSIDNSLGQKFPVLLTPLGLLKAMEVPGGDLFIDYTDSKEGLLKSIRFPNGDFRTYTFDQNGQVISVASESGYFVEIKAQACPDLIEPRKCLKILSNGQILNEIEIGPLGKVTFPLSQGK